MDDRPWDPDALLALSGGYWQTCTLHAGVRLGIFTILGDGGLDAEGIARKISADSRGVSTLLNALTAMKLLERKGGAYANTEASRRWLAADSSDYIGHMILHHHHLMASWSRLDEAVRSGTSIRTRSSHGSDEQRESFLMGMYNLAMKLAPRMAAEIDCSGRRHLLDLGGGPGTYAIHFCLANPGLKATVFDLSTTRPFAQKTIARFKLADRIAFSAGDYLQDDIPGRYDVALLSHVLHGEGPEDCRRMIRKAISALDPGGLIIIHEFILEDSLDAPLHPALFSLNMLLGTEAGRAYSEGQLTDMLAGAGVKDIRRLPFRSANDTGVLTGTV